MAAVIGRTIQNSVNGECCSSPADEEVFYYDSPRRGFLSSSFAPFYIVVIALNTVAIFAGIASQYDFHFHDLRSGFAWMDSWYLCNAVFGVIHILAALYLVSKIEEPSNPEYNKPSLDLEYRRTNDDIMQSPPSPAARDIIVRDTTGTIGNDYHRDNTTEMAVAEPAVKKYDYIASTEPESFARIKHVLLESKLFALYILIFLVYVLWHKVFDVRTNHPHMLFVMRCADIFIIAGPASFLFSAILLLVKRREL